MFRSTVSAIFSATKIKELDEGKHINIKRIENKY